MKSVFILLCRLAISKECSSTENDDLFVECTKEDCFIVCNELGKIPEKNLDYVKCDTDTGIPEVPFPTKCITPTCSTLSPPPGLNIQCNEGNERCEFSCRNSGSLIGPEVVYCNDDGTWSEQMPTCGNASMAKCPSLESPYAIISCTNGESRGSTCAFRCEEPRFLREGDLRSITCEYSNNQLLWSGSTPSCQLIVEAPETTQETPEITTLKVTETPDVQTTDENCDETDTIWSIIKCNTTVVGIGVGVFLVILIIAIGVACCANKRKQIEDEKNAINHLWETNPTIQRSLPGSSRGESTQDAIVHNNTRTFRENKFLPSIIVSRRCISEPSGSFYRPNRQAAQYHSRYNQSPHAQANPYSQVQLGNQETEPFIFDPSNGTDQNYPVSRGLTNQNYQPYSSAGPSGAPKQSSSNPLSTFFVPNT